MGVLQRRYSYYQHSSKSLTPFVTMKKKIKTWLIHLLGGVTVEESKNSGKGYYRIEWHCLSQFCEDMGLDYKIVQQRLYRGMSLEKANNEHTAHLLGTTDPYTEGGSE